MAAPIRAILLSVALVTSSGGVAMLLSTDALLEVERPHGPTISRMMRELPLSFIENRGQVNSQARYYLQGTEASVYFTRQGLALSVQPGRGRTRSELTLEFPGSDSVSPRGVQRAPGVVSSFTGPVERGISTYSRVAYRDLWPGIDAVYSGTSSRLKYRFVVAPGADPGQVGMAWGGTTGLRVNDRDQLEVTTTSGTVIDDTPYSYQMVEGQKVEVSTSYDLNPGGDVGFRLGAFDPTRPLVIDPALLIYAGYIGGSGSDQGNGIAVDGSGNTYLTGDAGSDQTTFPDGDGFSPIPGPDQTNNGGDDAFVAKVNPAGTALVYAGYIGGLSIDSPEGIAVDGSGNAYVTGHTTSNQTTFPDGDDDMNDAFPVPGPDQTYNGGFADAFVAKVNAAGTALVYAGYIGGSGVDFGNEIAVDGSGTAYVTGSTGSDQTTFPDGDPNADDLFPVPGTDQTYNGGTNDAFVAKVNAAGTALVYAGYIGGSGDDQGFGIAVDGSANTFVTGSTDGGAFPPLPGPDQTHNGGTDDAFVAKVNAAGTALVYGGYIGGSGAEIGKGIAVDGPGNAYVTGETDSDQTTFPDGDDDTNNVFPVPGPDQIYNGGTDDAFVAKVNAGGTALVYAGYIGGSGADVGAGIAVDGSGNAYLTGTTASNSSSFPDGDPNGDGNFPVPSPDQDHNGGQDAFVAEVNAGGTALVYAGYIGGSGTDIGNSIAVDGSGNAYVTGSTDSDKTTFPDGDANGDDAFPVPGPDQIYNGGTDDAFVAKVEFTLPPVPPAPSPGPSATCKGKNATIVGTNGNDSLTGTSGADVVAGLGGKDTIKALGGNDLVCAGDANDTANGGGGKDKLNGEGGKDKLKGGGANDKLNGGSGKDTCIGGSGEDKSPACEKEKSIP